MHLVVTLVTCILYYSVDRNGSVVVNFTLVFIKGNKTVDELVQVLQNSVDNGSIQMIPVERPTLRLVLPSEFMILYTYLLVGTV